jgi:hypothetical protein
MTATNTASIKANSRFSLMVGDESIDGFKGAAQERGSEQHIFGLKLAEDEVEQLGGVEDLGCYACRHVYDRSVDAWSHGSGDGRVAAGGHHVAGSCDGEIWLVS